MHWGVLGIDSIGMRGEPPYYLRTSMSRQLMLHLSTNAPVDLTWTLGHLFVTKPYYSLCPYFVFTTLRNATDMNSIYRLKAMHYTHEYHKLLLFDHKPMKQADFAVGSFIQKIKSRMKPLLFPPSAWLLVHTHTNCETVSLAQNQQWSSQPSFPDYFSWIETNVPLKYMYTNPVGTNEELLNSLLFKLMLLQKKKWNRETQVIIHADYTHFV